MIFALLEIEKELDKNIGLVNDAVEDYFDGKIMKQLLQKIFSKKQLLGAWYIKIDLQIRSILNILDIDISTGDEYESKLRIFLCRAIHFFTTPILSLESFSLSFYNLGCDLGTKELLLYIIKITKSKIKLYDDQIIETNMYLQKIYYEKTGLLEKFQKDKNDIRSKLRLRSIEVLISQAGEELKIYYLLRIESKLTLLYLFLSNIKYNRLKKKGKK